eukprot:SAG22_NODE_19_length_32182_cov_39.206963_25_plen_504_part_00
MAAPGAPPRARLLALYAHVSRSPAASAGDESTAAAVVTDVVDLDAELKELAAESLIQPGHDLSNVGSTKAGKELVVVGGKGAWLELADGTQLLDGPGGIWNVNMGYGQTAIIEAVTKQMEKLPFNSPFATIAEPAAVLAKKIGAVAPGDLNHVFFVTGGSEANDTALQFVYYRNNFMGKPQKKIVLARDRAYHGSTYMSHSVSMDTDNMDSVYTKGLVSRLTCPDPMHRGERSPEGFTAFLVEELLDRIEELGSENIAALIAEPIMGAGGCIVPPPGYLQAMAEVCAAKDIVYISDEVVTGFGRLGAWFASADAFGVQPDILTFAKGITSGYQPLGGVLISDRLLKDVARAGGRWQVGYTYSGHPTCCAAGIANMDLMESSGIMEHVQAVGPQLQQGLKKLEGLPLCHETRGMGLMAGIELVDWAKRVPKAKAREAEALSTEQCRRISEKSIAGGVLVRMMRNRAVISPCLVIDSAEVAQMVDVLYSAVRTTGEELEAEGRLL